MINATIIEQLSIEQLSNLEKIINLFSIEKFFWDENIFK